jgi:uncharacterized OB-fold protein
MSEVTNEKRIPVIDWFTQDAKEPRLIGNKCKKCGDIFFPKASACRNPKCMSDDLEDIFLSNKGTLWSFTINHYPPPAPYVAPDPFVPYAIVVVELKNEQLSVAGQLADGYNPSVLKTGMEMELVVETLYEDEKGQHTIWKWKPVLGGEK